jgi:hypothetical protein
VQKLVKLKQVNTQLGKNEFEIEEGQKKLLLCHSQLIQKEGEMLELRKAILSLEDKYSSDIQSSTKKALDYEAKYGNLINVD